jgi:propionyl-CoA carboxylase alpha chain
VVVDGRDHPVAVRAGEGGYVVEADGEPVRAATDWRPGKPVCELRLDGRDLTIQIERLPGTSLRLTHGGVVRRVQVLSPRAGELLALMPPKKPRDTSRLLLSPMPGLLSAITVTPGQEIKTGEPLAIVEAMKMENVLRAERDGRVARLRAKPGDNLAVDEVILEFE